ncbi:fibrinogen-like protein 1 [Mercenaria mercenaria]|uniref:fibrinogen-like protein 1 n=1 Tax=Mercenaria mercenaria TaxID=6596 RepID=UPI00234ECFB1|nr:fibrinogen-like protein 1 [Mercenaria mercenaria]
MTVLLKMQNSAMEKTVLLLIILNVVGIDCSVSQGVVERIRDLANRVDSGPVLKDEDYAAVIEKLGEIDKTLNVSLGQRDGHVGVTRKTDEVDLTAAEHLGKEFKKVKSASGGEMSEIAKFLEEFTKIEEDLTSIKQYMEKYHMICLNNTDQLDARIEELYEVIESVRKEIIQKQVSLLSELNKTSRLERQEFNAIAEQMAKHVRHIAELSGKKDKTKQSEINTTHSENSDTLVNKPTVQIEQMNLYTSCKHAKIAGSLRNGVYKLRSGLEVVCDQTTDGGGWTVFQRRKNGEVDFYRDWAEYKNGFGDLNGEFWLGNKYLNNITGRGDHGLRIDMEDFDGNKAYTKYSKFKVYPEEDMYKLHVSGYSGNAGNSLKYHNKMAFTTFDDDNDNYKFGNCARQHRGAWWYDYCYYSNLNGQYFNKFLEPINVGIIWLDWKQVTLKSTEMKFR